jgi:hypothetical protein
MKTFLSRLVFVLAATTCSVAIAEGEIEFVDYGATSPIDITGSNVDWSALGYDSAKGVRGIQEDWNGDGSVDTLVVSSENLCGTGGCPYDLIDGKSGRKIGELFGGPIFIHFQKINGWPVLTMYGHSSAESGTYTCMVYDGTKYVNVSGVMLYDRSVTELFNNLNKHRRKMKGQ